jgi:hypothetical protein
VQKTLSSASPMPPLYLLIQPFTQTIPYPTQTTQHTSYLVTFHRPSLSALKTQMTGVNSVNADPNMDVFDEVLHFVTVSQTVPSTVSILGNSLQPHQTVPTWFNEQKLRVLEAAVYGCFDSVVVLMKQRRSERSSISSGRPSLESGGFGMPASVPPVKVLDAPPVGPEPGYVPAQY